MRSVDWALKAKDGSFPIFHPQGYLLALRRCVDQGWRMSGQASVAERTSDI